MDLSDLIFPRQCLGCRKNSWYLCSSCLAKVSFPRPICPVCEYPSWKGNCHTACRKPDQLDRLISLWTYKGVVRQAILALKYKFAFQVGRELAEKMVGRIKKGNYFLPQKASLVPIPLYWRRSNWRGFNQVEEIGRLVAEGLGWQYLPGLLVRKFPTVTQTKLNRAERKRNVKSAFALKALPSWLTKTGLIILFDDVWTTGSTMKEATGVIKKSGIGQVWGLTVAR